MILEYNRREFSDNEKMLLYNEVDGRCPICGNELVYRWISNFFAICLAFSGLKVWYKERIACVFRLSITKRIFVA